jgi:hypothetical protein
MDLTAHSCVLPGFFTSELFFVTDVLFIIIYYYEA